MSAVRDPAPGAQGAALSDRALALFAAAIALLAIYSFGYDRWKLPPQIVEWGTFGRTIGGDLLPMLVVPCLLARFGLRRPLAEFGFRARPFRRVALASVAAYAALLPFVLWLPTRPEIRAFYPSPAFPPAREHVIGLAFLWLLHHVPQLLSVEACFRGFLFLPLARRLGFELALAAELLLYVVLHAAKPGPELFLAAWAAVVFSYAAWRTGSILPGFVAHWVLAVSIDLLCYLQLHRGP